ncbi:MAG TPA: T9SS type A sorting domain-containing protein, partial [Chitinophagaceae bacterium]|nr:T9SS type A sorting domain-containing protein [Chitinophagaceae bacterium]
TPPCMPNYDLGAAPVGGTCWPLNTSDLNTETPHLLIYPNPASSHLTLEFNHSSIKQSNYSLYNTMGQVLISGEINSYYKSLIDISSLPSGIYFIKCEGVIKKFVKE